MARRGMCISVYFIHACIIEIDQVLQKKLKPQDSFGRFVNIFLDLQKVDHTIRKHH